MSDVRPIEILLVEDNPGDVNLARIALEEARLLNNLRVVHDGQAALDYLQRKRPYEDVVMPDVVLLDWNLPKLNGGEVLKRIKETPVLKRIPVIVLTTSDSDEHVLRAYDAHANSYIQKPIDMNRFIEVVQSIGDFWLGIVTLPSGRRYE